jgi:hypothetical protein
MEPGKWPGTPLYPPSAAPGHTPSKDSPLVVAVKRATAHLGAIPWEPDKWDDSYNEKIADAVAEVQRWSGTLEPATGWFGEKSFNFYRSVLMGESRPNAGQPAWDATCVQLTEDAYKQAHPPPQQKGRELLFDHFEQRDGYTEQPADSNCDTRPDGIRTAQDLTAQGSTWLRNEPWCGCWCYYALHQAGVTGMNSWMASVASIEDRAKQKLAPFTGWTTDRAKVRLGDLVVVGGYGVHVETVRGFSGSNTLTWGGNTSAGTSGSQSNGGGAYHRTRYPSEVRGYALVRYPGE